MSELQQKYQQLLENLRALGSVAVAFSAGVDSTLLLWAARRTLGKDAVALTASLCAVPARELAEAEQFCAQRGIDHALVDIDVLAIPGFRENPRDRCYHCKHAIMAALWDAARARGLHALVEGSNLDDEGDVRPGRQALRELGVRSPLLEVGLTKTEIRALSRELGLPGWNKPSLACLASRIAYGEAITPEKLARVDRAEECLHRKGFTQCRVRVHGSVARIELLPEEIGRFLEPALRDAVRDALLSLGFAHVSLDLSGYRSGSMNV